MQERYVARRRTLTTDKSSLQEGTIQAGQADSYPENDRTHAECRSGMEVKGTAVYSSVRDVATLFSLCSSFTVNLSRQGKCIPNSGDKRKREGEGDDGSVPKKPREAVEITATRHDSQVQSLQSAL